MIAAPGPPPARPDLDWLRHRSRRRPGTAEVSATTESGGLADFLSGRTTRRQPEAALTPAPSPPAPSQVQRPTPASDLDLEMSTTDPLDLSGPPRALPTTAPAPAPVAQPGGELLDLRTFSRPPTTRRPASPPVSKDLDLSSSGLDLSEPALRPGPSQVPVPAPLDLSDPPYAPRPVSSDLDLFLEAPAPRTAEPPPRPEPVVRKVPRVPPGGRVILTPREPTVTLDRVQSGVGALTVTAVCSPAVGDLVLGAVYQLADGSSGVVSRTAGIPTAPPRSRRPVLEAHRGEFDQMRVDLRQSRSLRRLVVYAVSASESTLAWGGTLLLTTHGGSRVEIPLDLAPHDGPVVLASVCVVDGEFVVRAELDRVHGFVRDVAQAYGFRAITWADARTPVL